MDGLTSPNRTVLEAVARRLRPLLDEVVFVGGQVAELLITDPAAIRIRPTDDVDVVVGAASRSEYHRTEELLRELGFSNDTSEGSPVCRWVSPDAHRLDLMPSGVEILGFSNRWYPRVLADPDHFSLAPDLVIAIPHPPLYLATKLAAFRGRGRDDVLGSHDLEDVITLVAGRPELGDEVQVQEQEVREWIAAEVAALLSDQSFSYAVEGALPDAARMPEFRRDVLARFEALG